MNSINILSLSFKKFVINVGILLIFLYSNHFAVLMFTVISILHKEWYHRKAVFEFAQTSSAYRLANQCAFGICFERLLELCLIIWRFWLISHVRPLELMRQVGLFTKAVVVEIGFCFSYYIHSMWKGILKADIITQRFQVWHLLPIIPLLLLIPDRDHCWLWVIHSEEFEACNKHLSYGEVNFLHQKSVVLVNWYAPFPLYDSWV